MTQLKTFLPVAAMLLLVGASGCNTFEGVSLGRWSAFTHAAEASRSGPHPESVIHTLSEGEDLTQLVSQSDGPVLVDFYADWCGPCKQQAVILHDLDPVAADLGAKIIKVDIEEHEDLAREYRVASLPTLMVIKDGQVTKRKQGRTPRKEIEQMLGGGQ